MSQATAATLHLITGEYPPQFGGVSDYTRSVAVGLAAAGASVHIWCPATTEPDETPAASGVTVHRSAGRWCRPDLARLDRELDQLPGPRRLIVQWVPQAYGHRSLNVGFCAWVRRRAGRGDTVDLMVHEAFLAFGEGGWKQDLAAVVHRLMVSLLLSRARRVWVSIPAWGEALGPYCFWRRPLNFEWLPVPSGVPTIDDANSVEATRRGIADEAPLVVGHFSTYESQVRRSLAALVPALLEREPAVTLLLLGRGSDAFRLSLSAAHPALAHRIKATGVLDARLLSLSLQACDMVVQPYPDGASSRRTTLMTALAHGVPVVTTEGRLSEPLWRASGAVRVVPANDDQALLQASLELCADKEERGRLSSAGRALYSARFDIGLTVQAFLSEPSRAA